MKTKPTPKTSFTRNSTASTAGSLFETTHLFLKRIRNGYTVLLGSLLILIMSVAPSNAATIIVTISKNWSALSGGSGPGGLPGSTDTVRVRNGAILLVDMATATCNLISIGQGGLANTTSTLAFGNNSILTTQRVTIGGAGTRRGSINMTAGGLLRIGASVTISNLDTFTAGTGTIEYNSTGPQNVSAGLIPAYNNLILGGGNRKNLGGNIRVSGTLTILNGRINISTFVLTIGAAGSINVPSPSNANMLVASGGGEVRKVFTADGSITFPIGDNTGGNSYTPIALDVRGTAYANAYVGVSVTKAKHPNNASANHFLKRYWTVNQSGITGCNADVTARYTNADINGTENLIRGGQLNGTFNQLTNPWIQFGPVNSPNNLLTASNAVLTAGQSSAFTGITRTQPSVTVSGGSVTVCSGSPVQLNTTVTGDPVFAYSWAPAAGLSSTTVPNPVASPLVNTTYTVTAYNGNGITTTGTATINVDSGTIAGQPGGITGDLIICDGALGILYSVQPVPNAVSYNWTVPAGATIASGAGTLSVTVDFPTPFTGGDICVSAVNSCNIPSTPRCTTLTNITAFTPNSVVGSGSVCLNSTGNSYNVQPIAGATHYDWTVPVGMTISSGQGTNGIIVDVGASLTPGDVCVTVSNACGTSLPSCKFVTTPPFTMPGGITGTDTICANTAGLPYTINPINGAISYTWTVPLGCTIASGQGTDSITVDIGANPTAGDICVTADYTCGSSLPQCLTLDIVGTTVGNISGPASVCEGSFAVPYSVAAVAGATSYNWVLPAGMTQASGGTTNSITVDVALGYVTADICVSVTTACGTGAQKCRTIDVNTPNAPGPISGPIVICAGNNDVPYSIASVIGAVTYTWTGPAGTNITAGNTRFPLVDFDSSFVSGDLCVTTINACLVQSNPECITVYDISNFTPPAITGQQYVCANTFNQKYSIPEIPGADSYTWTLPAGITFSAGTTTDTNVVFVDIAIGFVSGDLCVHVSNSCGTSLDQCLNLIEFSIAPNMPGGITGNVVVCPGNNGLVYSIQPVVGAASYTWTLPADMTLISGQGTRFITVDIDPGYAVGDICVTATSPCGPVSNSRCLTVTTNTQYTPPNINGPGTFCHGDVNLVFRIASINGAGSYSWLLPNGMTFSAGSTIDSNVVFVDIDSSFTTGDICVATQASCGISNYRCKPVKEITYVTPGGITGPEIICQNTSGIVYSIQPVSGAVSYEWLVPPGITITAGDTTTSITVDVSASFVTGDIGVRAIATCGKKSLIRWNNTTTSVNPALPDFIDASGDVCPGATVTFSVNAVDDAASYAWILPAGMTFSAGSSPDSNVVTVDVGSGFFQGDVCVKAVSVCGVSGYMRCHTYNINLATPGTISGPLGVCPNATGLVYSVSPVEFAATYEWTLPNGWLITSGTGTNSITASADPSFYQGQVSVNAVSSCGNKSARRYLNISINPGTPSPISGPFAPCPGTVAVYDVSNVTGADGYQWMLPAGMTVTSGTSSTANSISLDVDNTYVGGTICVMSTTSCGGMSAARCLTLGTVPQAPLIITGDPTVCAGTNGVSYSVEPILGVTSFTWTTPANMTIQSGQGFNALIVDIDNAFTGGQLCVTANSACASSASTCLDIGLIPPVPADIIQPVNFCPGTAQTLSVERIPGATVYDWTLPAGLTELYGQGSPSITVFVAPGYTPDQVCVHAETPCGGIGTDICETIEFNAAQTPATITASSVVCPGSDVVFSAGEINDAGLFNWTVPAGMTISSGQGTASIVVSVGAGFASGQVCVTAQSGCGIASAQRCVQFSTTPATPGVITAPPVICANSTDNIISVPVQSGIASYAWTVPAGLTITAGQGSNAIVVSSNGAFSSGTVSVTAASFCGTMSAARSITIGNLLPQPSAVTFSGPTCNNTTNNMAMVALLTGATSYLWTVPPDVTITSGQGTNMITFDIGSTFTSGQLCVQGISDCGDPGASRCPIIRSLPNRPSSITGPLTSVCNQTLAYSCPAASGATSYTWTAPANASIATGQGTRFVTVSFTGTFTTGQLEVVAVNSCGSSLPRLSSVITCGPIQPGPRVVSQETPELDVLAYPVPTSDKITVEFVAQDGVDHMIEIYELSGRLVLATRHVSQLGLNRITMDVHALPGGIYILRTLRQDGMSDQKRIVIQ